MSLEKIQRKIAYLDNNVLLESFRPKLSAGKSFANLTHAIDIQTALSLASSPFNGGPL